ncbi:hypothetical protein [Nitrosospira multiformis]|uniref:Uncharacterized protein n=1 Tax=Nitrosospira multiformis TaxID=1231 RepID=A0A1I7I3Z7_9PROT|nr:hypothetical protein [Nitrosospira multiformis]SFU67655.1 hypothetical protein SAMN05216417_11429 [Nitrosospira multiformis]
MNYKRAKPKNSRAGCLLCKPHKMNGAKAGRGLQPIGKTGFSNQRKEKLASIDLKDDDK